MTREGAMTAATMAGGPAGAALTPPDPGVARRARAPGLKVGLFAVVTLALVAVTGLAVWRESSQLRRVAATRPATSSSRPALSPSEEAYARALWPIHNEVKGGALRMTFGGLNYKLREIDRATLRERVESARAVYRDADARIRALAPPTSLAAVHGEYLQAVHLYQEAATEMVRASEDGQDDHLAAAFPKSQEAGTKLLRVGQVLWPGEYVPN
jgi:hypothetical protein